MPKSPLQNATAVRSTIRVSEMTINSPSHAGSRIHVEVNATRQPGSSRSEIRRRGDAANQATSGLGAATADEGTALSISSEGLRALEHAGRAVVDVVESAGKRVGSASTAVVEDIGGLASGAWSTVERATAEVGHLAAQGWDEVAVGAAKVEKAGEAAFTAVEVGAKKLAGAVADVVSDAAGSAAFVVSAGGKTLRTALSELVGPVL